ncbi:type II secretion system F family protein [Halolamina sp. CBA1230]|uniref:type II secretion system F family protein n=1 Tax=Halolamina sp. CBA1230 TaxID=1853690 RepID=UPI0009A1B317|nr:type II secretion system F family protein [Halolamina sp. CBA1230]QKY20858.1 type II secretion system F family protein [Halolamina sp. CBA1230]
MSTEHGSPGSVDGDAAASRLSALDRALYTLFASEADAARHSAHREQYRGTDLGVGFDVYVARLHGLAWLAAVLAVVPTLAIALAAPEGTYDVVAGLLARVAPVGVAPRPPRLLVGAVVGTVVGVATRHGVIALGGRYLGWLASARQADIGRTLPGAARYLHALSSGADSPREMLRKVAENDAYGETAVAARKVLNTAALTGSLNEGLRRVARDTPSRDTLAPFLLKFREHSEQGGDALANYLGLEARMLGHQRSQAQRRNEGFLELVAELFVVLLVLPALLVVVLTVMSVLAPGLSAQIPTPLGPITTRALLIYGAAAFVLLVGAGAATTVGHLRPTERQVTYSRPEGPLETLRSTLTNPASAAVVLAPLALAGIGAGHLARIHPLGSLLAGYVAWGVPVGAVAVRRARIDDAKDREIQEFVHAVSGHVGLGRPFGEAVELVAEDVDLGPLQEDVASLAFDLSLSDSPDGADRRTAALSRFVDRVGTPLAAQTMGLVTGAFDAGSDTESVFETLQTEVGQLYHEKRALRSDLAVYVGVGWVTALLVVAIVVAVDLYVLDGFAQLSAMPGSAGFALDPNAIRPERERFRFAVVAVATSIAAGWFAGMASRGPYDALLHSGLLGALAAAVFAGVGLA